MDLIKVIYLGHKVEQPLMCSASELADGYEPHDQFYPARLHARTVYSGDRQRGVYPGCGSGWVPGRGTIPGTAHEADLTLI